MKLHMIAAGCAALCSTAAFAAPLNPQTQAPEVTYYIGGASAQAQAVAAIAGDLFQTPADVVTITSVGTTQKAVGYYGIAKTSLVPGNKRMLVVYNNTNGSNAGVRQLLSNGKTEAEADVVTVGTSSCTAPATATLPNSTATGLVSNCTSHALTEVDLALSDVNPTEAVPGVLAPGAAGNIKFSDLTITTTSLEGFGIAVNPALYAALQNANIADGILPGSCAGSSTAACQPSVRRADYASLVNIEGSAKDAGGFLGNSDTTPLTLNRRVDLSGSQAASNIFFGNNVCGTAGFFGALTPLHASDSNPGVLDIVEHAGTGNVKTALNTGTNYQIGVMSLENAPGGSDSWKWVKIDGVSPNFTVAGAADAKQRINMTSGAYQFATNMTASYRNSPINPVLTGAQVKALGDAVITGLTDSTKHDLLGIGYLDLYGTYVAGGKQSRVSRAGFGSSTGTQANNCQPLIN